MTTTRQIQPDHFADHARQMPESHQPSGRLELHDHILQHSQPAIPRLCRLKPLVPSSPGHWLLGAAKATGIYVANPGQMLCGRANR